MVHKEVDDPWKLMDCEEEHTMTKPFVLIDKDAEKLIQMNVVQLSSKVSKFLATFNLVLMSIIFIKAKTPFWSLYFGVTVNLVLTF